MKSTVVDRIWRRIRRAPEPDPTLRIDTPSQALDTAALLLNHACAHSVPAALWANMACRPLAALLYTASPAGNDTGMPWVQATAEALRRPAGWELAAEACANINPLLADWLISSTYDSRQRLSIAEALIDATSA